MFDDLIPDRMNNNFNNTPATGVAAPTPAVLPVMPTGIYPMVIGIREQRYANKLVRQLGRSMMEEQYRMIFAQAAMGNIANLATLASHLGAAVPYGAGCYEAILHAFTLREAERITRL